MNHELRTEAGRAIAPDPRTGRQARMRLLVPLDRSHRDSLLVPYCRALVATPDARLVFMHVVNPATACAREEVERAASYLNAVAGPIADDGIDVQRVVRIGEPAAEIIAVSQEADADLIVMATRVQGDGPHAGRPSVAAEVMQRGTRSIVVVSEAALLRQAEERTHLQSEYMAGVIWMTRCHGILTDQQAIAELHLLAAAGLDAAVLRSVYSDLASCGARPAWIDFDAQVSTLRQFLPDALPRSDGADAA